MPTTTYQLIQHRTHKFFMRIPLAVDVAGSARQRTVRILIKGNIRWAEQIPQEREGRAKEV